MLTLLGPTLFVVVSLTRWRRAVREGGLPATRRETVVEIAKALSGAALILAAVMAVNASQR